MFISRVRNRVAFQWRASSGPAAMAHLRQRKKCRKI
jgi:hypothetical protein